MNAAVALRFLAPNPRGIGGLVKEAKPESPLLAVARGEPDGVRDCLDEYGSLVWSLARRWLRHDSDVEDAVQEIFIDLWKSAKRFDRSKASEFGFVAMIARRRLIDRRRRIERRPTLVEMQPGLQTSTGEHLATEARVGNQHVLEALATLRDDHRHFIELSFVKGLSHSEIADHTDTPLGTVKSAIRRSLLQLRATLTAQGEGPLEGLS